MNRRTFLTSSAVAATGIAVKPVPASFRRTSMHSISQDIALGDRIYKTLKYNMVGVEGTLTDKFKAAKEAGFAAIELDSPLRFSGDVSVEDANKAVAESGLPVDGTVCGSHWKLTHSSPDADMRAAALKDLIDAIEQTDAIGGTTVLLVAGHGKDGTPEEIDARAIENISKALPTAAKHGVTIVIENVWNRMHYDHDGDSNQTAERLVKFVDAFNSPFVGMQFDIGNHWKYGSMGDWIRQLGKRIVKLDLKGFSREQNRFTKIGEGDLDWADVRKALVEINFYGYAAAEVGGGDMARLKEVSANMDAALGL
ncbi:sugar phosphate isomerase/epimerase family protein [Mariniblastus fucicola]|uniref:Fructoselysine 3-epimerase n=1 Tax=Mariniblastus fucicola TaxID=980251 RepID=A0A5B9PCS0_9BACT|nr:sugar phosphate isomerase/epimerase family protein [Mariniblastus fucicola]QEG24128.1 fructoselysine 3-epimerase [Mariniblastus fucicola]